VITPLILEFQAALSPLELFEAFRDEPYAFLLESGLDLFVLGRFSFLGADPFLLLRTKGDTVEVTEGQSGRSFSGDPFEALGALLSQYRVSGEGKPAPLVGGAVGFFAYDLNRRIERLPARNPDDTGVPDCLLGFYDRVVILDHARERLYVASTGLPETEPGRARRRATLRAKEVVDQLRGLERDTSREVAPPLASAAGLHSNFTEAAYCEAVRRAKEHIAAGDIYQVNLSQRFTAELPLAPFDLYRRLRRVTPAPFAGFLNFDDVRIVSASPERFLWLEGRRVETRPMKGTRPRGKTPAEDRELGEELLRSEKEKAELVMIVDVARNDLGRVCKVGSVEVTALRTLEPHPTVLQTTATVVGRLAEDRDRMDLLRAYFPGASVTGAPKIRAMEIIEELEPTRRGIYTGALGYLSFDGDLDLSMVIRSFVVRGDNAFFHVGGGIVADSEPLAEYEETMVKARALLESLGAGNG
jgi:para-aminobenzoate synthetase component 1